MNRGNVVSGIVSYPRLQDQYLQEHLNRLLEGSTARPDAQPELSLDQVCFYELAVRRQNNLAVFYGIRQSLEQLAAGFGYPATPLPKSRTTAFDHELGACLFAELKDMSPYEAGTPEVWTFLTLIVAPGVARWRFPGTASAERFTGGHRNVFGRLWWRSYCLTPELAGQLIEDESVGIMERPTVGFNPRLAQMVATVHLRTLTSTKGVNRQDLLRDSIKRLRRELGRISVFALDDAQLEALVVKCWNASLTAHADDQHPISPSSSEPQTADDPLQRFIARFSSYQLDENGTPERIRDAMADKYALFTEHVTPFGNRSDLIAIDTAARLIIQYYPSLNETQRQAANVALQYLFTEDDEISDLRPGGLHDDRLVLEEATSLLFGLET